MVYGPVDESPKTEQKLFQTSLHKNASLFSKLLFRNDEAEVKRSARRNRPTTCKKWRIERGLFKYNKETNEIMHAEGKSKKLPYLREDYYFDSEH